jgi:parallel beta-helix repeat protein
LNSNIKNLTNQLNYINQNITDITQQFTYNITTLQNQMADAIHNLTTLKNQLSDTKGNVTTLQNQLTDTMQDISTLQNQLANILAGVIPLQNHFPEIMQNITILQNQLAKTIADVTKLQNQLEDNVIVLQNQLADTMQNITTLQNQLTNTITNVTTIQNQLTGTIDDINTLQNQMVEIMQNVTALQSSILDINNRVNILVSTYQKEFTTVVAIDGTGNFSNIQSAIDSLAELGGSIYIRPGKYIIDSSIIINRSNIQIYGNGLVVIYLNNSVNEPCIVIGYTIENPIETVKNVLISGLTINGNKNNQSSEFSSSKNWLRNNGISIRHAENITMRDNNIYSVRSGGIVTEKGCRFLFIENNRINNNYFDGIAVYETTDSILNNNILFKNKAAGFSIDWFVEDCIFSGNIVEYNIDQGMFLQRASNNTITDSKFIGTETYDGIYLALGSAYNIISNCQFKNNNRDGVHFDDTAGENNLLVGNFLLNNGVNPIYNNTVAFYDYNNVKL